MNENNIEQSKDEIEIILACLKEQVEKKRKLFELFELFEEREKVFKEKREKAKEEGFFEAFDQKNEVTSKLQDIEDSKKIIKDTISSIAEFASSLDDERFIPYKAILQAKTKEEMDEALKSQEDNEQEPGKLKQESNAILNLCDSVIEKAENVLKEVDKLIEALDEFIASRENENIKAEEQNSTIQEDAKEETDITEVEAEEDKALDADYLQKMFVDNMQNKIKNK